MRGKVDLSVIIVNYNVEYFLEQCLNSVLNALKNIDGEIIVVDNHSIDGSVAMIEQKFSSVQLIANKINSGFSKANNQALEVCQGKYALLLNPDTIVEEDTFDKILRFMDDNPDAGGLGVKMIDGKGNFLPESKRGLPTPEVAFYKIFGLSKLFPKSKKFGKYHLGYLDKDEVHEVEILSGAFMILRMSVLDEIGYLDEAFFMYGEDIDLSYRIVKAGFKNYYFPKTSIIHYKGESTKKSSVNYVFVFYNAMVIFAKKHFSQKNALLFSKLINLAIYFRAAIAITTRLCKSLIIPFLDFILLITGLFFISQAYASAIDKTFPFDIVSIAIPIYTLIWQFSIYFSGGYDKPLKYPNIPKGIAIGTGIILIIYALLPKEFQFSRGVILIGMIYSLFIYTISRWFFYLSNVKRYSFKGYSTRFVIVGTESECTRVRNLLKQTTLKIEFCGYVTAPEEKIELDNAIGNFDQIEQVVDIHKVEEVIFCAKDVSVQSIIKVMADLRASHLDFKIAQPESLFLIGSNSINTSGDLYILNINTIIKPKNKRNKRILDFGLSALFLFLFPFILPVQPKKNQLFLNLIDILFGRKSFVGYCETGRETVQSLPPIRRGILSPVSLFNEDIATNEVIGKLNIVYAKDYSIWNDLKIIFNSLSKLGC